MAHGISLTQRAIQPAAPEFVHQHPAAHQVGGHHGGPVYYVKPAGMAPYRGPSRDRALPGKSRIRSRRAARAAAAGGAR